MTLGGRRESRDAFGHGPPDGHQLTRPVRPSPLAVAAIARDEAAGLRLGDAVAAARAWLAAAVVNGEEVAHFRLERGRDSLAQHSYGACQGRAHSHMKLIDFLRASVPRLRNGCSRAAWRISSE